MEALRGTEPGRTLYTWEWRRRRFAPSRGLTRITTSHIQGLTSFVRPGCRFHFHLDACFLVAWEVDLSACTTRLGRGVLRRSWTSWLLMRITACSVVGSLLNWWRWTVCNEYCCRVTVSDFHFPPVSRYCVMCMYHVVQTFLGAVPYSYLTA